MSKRLLSVLFFAGCVTQCAQAGLSCVSSHESRVVTHFNYLPISIRYGGIYAYHLADEDKAYVDLACSCREGALEARNEIARQDLHRRWIIFQYLVGKSQLPKYAPSIRAWAACLALCIADVSFAQKAELDKLLNVRDFEKLPEFWRTRARRAYQVFVKQYALNQPAKKFVK